MASASVNGRPSLNELQHDLEVVFVQLAQLYGLPAAVQALGQILSREPESLALAPASTLATSPTSPVVSPVAKPGIARQSPGIDRQSQSPQEIHTGERQPVKGGLARALAARPTHPAGLWRRAVQAAQKVADPWASRCLHVLAMEHCIRHRYKSGKHHWVTDDVLVKMEGKPFAAGAMRECFAMKKISTFSDNVYHDWQRAQNCVAKRYKKPTPNDAYFLDVLVQMDAKHMGEAYNRTDPPKQVDIMQAAIVEFPDRHGSPVMCIEQLMTGDYVKYNSNSGFVLGDDLLRYTPQAFSHFTWCWSKGQRICVDIQGVGDLYTDPQIHTIDGESYGDGNLGLRGIALFFRTHQCNALCARLHLKAFERCAPDVKAQGYTSDSSTRGAPLGGGGVRTLVRRTGSLTERLRAMQKRPTSAPQPSTQDELMTMLTDVPKVESPDSLVHLEVARVYSEVVLLPELRPEEAPEDALKGALFHLQQAAKQGCVLALTMLARTHLGIEPANTAFGHLIKVARQQGEVVAHTGVAWRAAVLAAERGVAGAALAVAHGYAQCQGLAEGVLDEPQPKESLHWYRRALEIEAELTAMKAAQEELEANAEGPSRPSGFLTRPSLGLGLGLNETIVEEDEEGSLAGSVSCTPPTDGIALERTQSQVTDTSETSGAGVITVKVPPPAHIPSAAFVLRQRLAAEEEASALPFASVHAYEIHAELGRLLMDQENGKEAIEHLNQAAELASVAGKGKLAQKYFELAAQAESM